MANVQGQSGRVQFLGKAVLVLMLLLAVWYGVRKGLRPDIPEASQAQKDRAARVTILRDEWGIAHVSAKTDADAAFGLAYAHAEDDWETLQLVMAATRGRLSLLKLDEQALANDYYTSLFRVQAQCEEQYQSQLSQETRALLEAYADGMNYYASLHPKEVDSRLYPFRGQDIAAGFIHKIPFMMGATKALQRLKKAEKGHEVGDTIQWPRVNPEEMVGSNAHAISREKSSDGVVRINCNSHQPWDGPVAWHEVHVRSEEGWNASGGLFPGAPVVLIGHNDHLAWTHTVNHADTVDVYKLELNPGNPKQYKFDGGWKDFTEFAGNMVIDTGLFDLNYNPTMKWSVHGPVVETDHGHYAIRYAGIGQIIKASEQWYRMNKAKTFEQWKQAMRIQGIPMFNTIYADPNNIYYVYNSLLPKRKEGVDWHTVLPGDQAELLWTEYLSFDELPQVTNPKAGYVQNCNSSPWLTTSGDDNPDREKFSKTTGIETLMTNRALRSHELFGKDPKISHEEFLRYKWDRQYTKSAPIYKQLVNPVLKGFKAKSEAEKKALELLKNWDGRADEHSKGATLAILGYRPIWFQVTVENEFNTQDPMKCFRNAVQLLLQNYGRVDVPLGRVQRLRRGSVDMAMGGGPDILNAFHGLEERGKIVGVAGDCYVLVVAFHKDGPRSWAIHQYGNVNRKGSQHYNDQAPLFVKRLLRPVLRTEAEIRERLESEYHPGGELKSPRDQKH